MSEERLKTLLLNSIQYICELVSISSLEELKSLIGISAEEYEALTGCKVD